MKSGQPRSSNKAQWWYCEKCKKKTRHETTPQAPVEAAHLPCYDFVREGVKIDQKEIEGYRRTRFCGTCHTEKTLFEVSYQQLDDLVRELNRLRVLRTDSRDFLQHQQAFSSRFDEIEKSLASIKK